MTTEHWYQASKTVDGVDADYILEAGSAQDAKFRGRAVDLRTDWEDVKVDVMLNLLRAKFADNQLKTWLLETSGRKLVDASPGSGHFWGEDTETGTGQNMLGVLLMQVRDEIELGYAGQQ